MHIYIYIYTHIHIYIYTCSQRGFSKGGFAMRHVFDFHISLILILHGGKAT